MDVCDLWLSRIVDLENTRDISDVKYKIESNEIMRLEIRPKISLRKSIRLKIFDLQTGRNINISINLLLLDSF